MNVKEAKRIAFGSDPSYDLKQFYSAWQWLHDNETELTDPDLCYMDKLICDGIVKARKGYSYNR